MPEIIRFHLFVAGWPVHAFKRAVLTHLLQSFTHSSVYLSVRSNYCLLIHSLPPKN